jgi:four helix bundle protein
MAEPVFDHERLDVYRLSIEYVAFSYDLAKTLAGTNRHARDQWLRAAQSIPLNIAEGNGKQSLKDKNRFFEIARGSALECAAIHDVLRVCDAIDDDANQLGKSNLKRILSMLTRLIQRTTGVSEERIEYEYEYRPDSSGLSTSTNPARNPDEPSDATERKWRSNFFLKSRSLAPFPPADRRRYAPRPLKSQRALLFCGRDQD